MNSYKTFTSLYCLLKPHRFIPNRLLSPIRYLVRGLADIVLSRRLKYIVPSYSMERPDVIISLTSFPARIPNIWKVIRSLKLQQIKPGKIILWLSEDQIPSIQSLPSNLLEEQDDLFQIRIMPGDLKSHKKYIYVIKEYPEKIVITVDDDIIYHPETIKTLLDTASKRPNCVIANIAAQLTYDDGQIKSSLFWTDCRDAYADNNLIQIGAGGVLYPPHCLNEEVTNERLIYRLAPKADDLWLNAMARVNNTPIVKSGYNFLFLPIFVKTPSLYKDNVDKGENNTQLKAIRDYLIEEKGVDYYSEK